MDEVVLSIAFEHNSGLVGPRLGLSLSELLEDYPRIEQQATYEMPLELPPGSTLNQGVGIRFELLHGNKVPQPRYWLISEDETHLIQVQPNYLALNWRRRSDEQDYPGYVALLKEFERVYSTLSDKLASHDGEGLAPVRAEITYIDVLRPSELWRDFSDTHHVISLRFADETEYETLNFTYTKAMYSPSHEFIGRVHVGAEPALEINSRKPVLKMAITARSAQFNTSSRESVTEFFSLAHTTIIDTFTAMTTAEARKSWGLE
ncbi:TIGR04255 family protein [Lentzea sp. BCCO 10_0798]|uniref:TIGR04255 family protein n=1 Tax=Lentzea kristufekii TaxID=3095430 RepID=A0ABU4TU97_9PSEU|nr:TIGR04255 family protein [Lentzea sp. BCCO 10_0798]MDX8051878.1 TIGR04255 family protein [Lentzea sp. BCCO 10_0798]